MKGYVTVFPSSLHGSVDLPPSKSHTMRALLMASLASGKSELYNLLRSPDTLAMIRGLTLLGAKIDYRETSSPLTLDATVEGIYANIQDIDPKDAFLHVGNSGQALRFLTPLFCFQKTPIMVTGDHSVCNLRSMAPLGDALRSLGGHINYIEKEGFAPFSVYGPFHAGEAVVDGTDSQPISSLLMSLPFLSRDASFLRASPMGEKPWVRFTLWWMEKVGLSFSRLEENYFAIPAGQRISSFTYTVPGDLSSMAFPLALALLSDSKLAIRGVDLTDPQGDKKIIHVLQQMGADIRIDPQKNELYVEGPQTLRGIDIDMDDMVDALPVLSVVGAKATGSTRLYNMFSARNKESDRLKMMASILRTVGAHVEEENDTLTIHGGIRRTKEKHLLESSSDHRIAMASIVLASLMEDGGGVDLGPVECIDKSFPDFLRIMALLGLKYTKASFS